MIILFKKNKNVKTKYDKSNRIELYPDTPWDSPKHKPWDDFGYKTSFIGCLFYKGKEYELPIIKILVENEKNTHNFLKTKLTKSKTYLLLPLENEKYISLSTDLEFYDIVRSVLNVDEQNKVLDELCDASYIQNTPKQVEYKDLMESEGFYDSLLRDMGSKKSLESGWMLIDNRTYEKDIKFNLNFKLEHFTNYHEIEINLKEGVFPKNINILIGANGTGKSQTINYLIESLLGLQEVKTNQIEKLPVFNQIVLIAYSPFENFIRSIEDTFYSNKKIYRYFGFKDGENLFIENKPAKDSFINIVEIINEDIEKDYYINRKNKLDIFFSVMKKAIHFDSLGFELKEGYTNTVFSNTVIDDKYYIVSNPEINIQDDIDITDINDSKGIIFFKNKKPVKLSSGQLIFSYIISSIVSAIREDTLLLIDEPELYLHPNLEVELVELIKDLLDKYNSHAIIATHSSVITREVSREYITVLKRDKKNPNIIRSLRPPFETFGGDLELINSYVFFDKDIDKPYEKWLQHLVNEEGSFERAIDKYKSRLNEESIILMHGMKATNAN